MNVAWSLIGSPFFLFLLVLLIGGTFYVAWVEYAESHDHTLWDLVGRLARTGKALAKSDKVPRWLRLLFVFGLLPIPLFLDEAVLVLAVMLMAVFYRPAFRRAWEESTR